MHKKDVEEIANSVDPESWSALFAWAYLSENLGSLWYPLHMWLSHVSETTRMLFILFWKAAPKQPCNLQLQQWGLLTEEPCGNMRNDLKFSDR